VRSGKFLLRFLKDTRADLALGTSLVLQFSLRNFSVIPAEAGLQKMAAIQQAQFSFPSVSSATFVQILVASLYQE
jgi:hypothetical protein